MLDGSHYIEWVKGDRHGQAGEGAAGEELPMSQRRGCPSDLMSLRFSDGTEDGNEKVRHSISGVCKQDGNDDDTEAKWQWQGYLQWLKLVATAMIAIGRGNPRTKEQGSEDTLIDHYLTAVV